MKIVVVNFSGNVGKSTIAYHLLAPRMQDAEVIDIESKNVSEGEEEGLRGKQFAELSEALALLNDAVVDVGSSNAEDFVTQMRTFRGSHEDFDYFIVPTVSATKQQRDTVSTIETLSEMGVSAKKIRVLFNQVEPEQNVQHVFTGIFDYQNAEKTFTIREDAVVHSNELFPRLKGLGKSIAGILADPTDLKEELKAAKDDDAKLRISRLIALKRLAVGVTEELDVVFKALLK
jgi:hypothetical protein